ncbi:MAG: BMP family ABC transporter substrate-binding protein [Rhizobiales bacterium]|nr:BMP family ABC transporter substrate-binding protein [Hyphomicrobiales bacterium]
MNLLKSLTAISCIAAFGAGGPALADDPASLGIAGVLSAGTEAPWDGSFVASMEEVIEARPHGLDITFDYTENVYENAEEVFRTYAETGEYDIIFGDTAYADAIEAVKDDFPETMFVMSGSGNRGLGGNAYWVFIHAHEPAYAMGMLAGRLTETNVIGAISTFPAEDTNDQINAFFAGAKEINPEIEQKITYIQSWFDPAKSNEATTAQIAAGADMIYQMSGAFEVCQQETIGCFGNYVDMAPFAPESVVASTTISWVPHIAWIIDEWWTVQITDAEFDAPMEPTWFTWAEGAGDLVLNPDWSKGIPEDVQAAVEQAAAAIKSGEKTVQLDMSEAQSD